MIFQTENLIMSEGNEVDLNALQEIYNSNSDFLLAHIDQAEITLEWLIKELDIFE